MEFECPDDFILSTGVSHTLKQFLEIAFRSVGILRWEKYVKYDQKLARPAEVYSVVGDNSKANNLLGWMPVTPFEKIIETMVNFDLNNIENVKRPNFWKPNINE